MIIKKIFETRFDIKDTNQIFCADFEKNLLSLLKETYNNRCYKSSFILNVEKIVHKGSIYCKNKVLDGSFYVDLKFEGECLIYEKGEVIHNCKIIQITNNTILHGKSKYASIQINNKTKMDIFKEGEEIPVLVERVRYNIYDTEIAVLATPLIPTPLPLNVFRIVEDVNIELDEKEIEKDIIMYKNNISKHNEKVVKFFRDLLTPYNKYNIKNNFDKVKLNKQSLDNLNELNINDLITISDSYLDDDIYYKIEGNIDMPIIDIARDEFRYGFLLNYKKNLYKLDEFCVNYDKLEKIKQKAHIWKLYNTLKK